MAELVGMRPAFGETLVELGRSDERVVALTGDVNTSDYSYLFRDAFPDRYFNVGIAEQCLIDVSVGLANTGHIPFPNAFAVFFYSRALEAVLTHLCYDEVPVKIMAGYCGLSPATEGPTHHAIADVAVMRALPNMTVVAPADPTALRKLLPQVKDYPGPVYFRFNRNEVPAIFGPDYDPVIGRAASLREGKDVTFVANGQLVARSLDAAERLAADGISAGVLEIHTIKPFDAQAVLAAAKASGAIVAAEEHVMIGGLGSAVAEVLAEAGVPATLRRVGINDTFAESGPYYAQLDKFGMSVDHLIQAARSAMDGRRVPVLA